MAKGTCVIDGCGSAVHCRGWCSRHYQSWRHHGDPLATTRELLTSKTCKVGTCDRQANEPGGACGYCQKHYVHWKKYGDPVAGKPCAGCGEPIRSDGSYCMRRKCRRLARAVQAARDPERYRAMQIASRARTDKAKRRAAEKRYKARTDRKCVRSACEEFAQPGSAYCHFHNVERGKRRSARNRLKIPRRLYIRQVGLCPDADHGGCGLPLGDPDGNHVDHLIPVARGGPDDDWNLQLMHPGCNHRKTDRLVPAARDAATRHGIVLLRPHGGRPRVVAA